jgi:2,3-bisphosphoglycerate-dependent phosphoglycerate mutase
MMPTTTLYVIRHARSAASLEVEETQWPLSEIGERQATALTTLLDPLGITAVHSSPYLRAQQTIVPFAESNGLQVALDGDLGERRLTKDALARFGDVWRESWDDLAYAPPGCESGQEAQARLVGAVRRIVEQATAETIAICSHGHAIGLLLHHLDERWGRDRAEALRNPDVLRIEVSETAWHLDEAFELPGLADVAEGRF